MSSIKLVNGACDEQNVDAIVNVQFIIHAVGLEFDIIPNTFNEV